MKKLALVILASMSVSATFAGDRPGNAVAAPSPDTRKPRDDGPVPYLLDRVQVIGQRLFPYQEGVSIDEKYVQSQAKGNGDIGTLLRVNPSVQFSDTAQTSRNMGEIRPANISINGGLFYQNNFQINGVSFSNDLDPANDNPQHLSKPPSDAQGLAVDTDLIANLTVYDSNVPAGFGGFNGGVVDLVTRKAANRSGGRISWRASRSAWNRYHIDKAALATFEASASQSAQPVYDKQKYSIMLENRFGNGLGLVAGISRLRSEIPLRGYVAGYIPEHDEATKYNTRQNTSYSLRADWAPARNWEIDLALNYDPTDERYFIVNTRNSWFDLQRGGHVATLRATRSGTWTVAQALSHSRLDSSRDGRGVRTWHTWAWSKDKNWGRPEKKQSQEGNWGDIDQQSRRTEYKLTADREAFDWAGMRHRIQLGFSASTRKGTYHRLNDHHVYIRPAATTSCTAADGTTDTVACSLDAVPGYGGKGQYLQIMDVYRAGYFEVRADALSLFMQDDIRWKRWSLRPGLRLDHDNLSRQWTLSPRLAVSWDMFGDTRSLLTGGINRYYGRNLFAYKLRDGRESLRTRYTRTRSGPHALMWRAPQTARDQSAFADIKLPYSDELTLGINQAWAGMDFNLKWVSRRNHDEVMRQSIKQEGMQLPTYTYVNAGHARSRTLTLGISPHKPWKWNGISTTAILAMDKTQVNRNFSVSGSDYDSILNDDYLNSRVRYRGKLMRADEIPARDFNRPWTARLAIQTRFGDSGLSWSHFLRYRSGFMGMIQRESEVIDDEVVRVYDRQPFPRSFTWDTTLQYEIPTLRNIRPYARVEVTNLLNRANLINAALYEPGRSYWLETGIRF
ncbi:hypothetical protein EBB59_01760 [Lysobacter pythonis]|uniref:TonB-dependent receptor n=1 Tax=Solilutibacter pythonis TaxID=2483112 RepID=A0A3M2HZK3_9GAMM|nr:hypothetical protein [Lysobacter pythonis]RMH94438.1 hypothetical protein EBB59_01760 [Lysobacter pythonis]